MRRPLGVSPGSKLCATFLNNAKYFKTMRCGCVAVAFIFSIYFKPVLYHRLNQYTGINLDLLGWIIQRLEEATSTHMYCLLDIQHSGKKLESSFRVSLIFTIREKAQIACLNTFSSRQILNLFYSTFMIQGYYNRLIDTMHWTESSGLSIARYLRLLVQRVWLLQSWPLLNWQNLRLRSGSCKFIFWHNFIIFC